MSFGNHQTYGKEKRNVPDKKDKTPDDLCDLAKLNEELNRFKENVKFLEDVLKPPHKHSAEQVDRFQYNLDHIYDSLGLNSNDGNSIKERFYYCIKKYHDNPQFKPTKNLILPTDSHSSWSMTDKEINPSPEGADLNLQRFKQMIKTIFLLFIKIKLLIQQLLLQQHKSMNERKYNEIIGKINNSFDKKIDSRYLFDPQLLNHDEKKFFNPQRFVIRSRDKTEREAVINTQLDMINKEIEKETESLDSIPQAESSKVASDIISNAKENKEESEEAEKIGEQLREAQNVNWKDDFADVISDGEETPRDKSIDIDSSGELSRVATEILESMLNGKNDEIEQGPADDNLEKNVKEDADELSSVSTEILESALNDNDTVARRGDGDNIGNINDVEKEDADELPRVATEILESILKGDDNIVNEEENDSDIGDENKDADELPRVATEILESMLKGDDNKVEESDAKNNDADELPRVATEILESMLKGYNEVENEENADELPRVATEILESMLKGYNEVENADSEATKLKDENDAKVIAERSAEVLKARTDDAALVASANKEAADRAKAEKEAADREKAEKEAADRAKADATAVAIPTTSSPTSSVSTSVKGDSDTTDDNDKILDKCGKPDPDYFLVGITKTENKLNAKESCIYFNKTTKDILVKTPPVK
jgi:hypothetical protein